MRGINLQRKSLYTKFAKISKLCSKSEAGVNFKKEISLNEICENPKVLLNKMRGGSTLQNKSLLKKKYENLRFWLQITNWNPILLAWLFKNTFPYTIYENKIPTPQLDIKFSNPQECWWQFFITHMTRYITYLHIHKVCRKLKDPFGTPSHPTQPHQIHPKNLGLAASSCRCSA